ncbi:MAG: ABC transporter ATP-binding protein [Endomicrobium sp.]|jgi:phospholipid/cholesterol/gamma-HCH transport system ATP-binding protein|nr:ABC transporter ATP-binding protein [Endomicrobium sp.]
MIKVDNIHKRFGVKTVLNGVSFEVCSGETLVIIGSSGAGKSILLKNIIGLIKPDSGFIDVDGVNITNCSLEELYETRKKIGYVFQESALFDSLNVFENVAFGLKNLTSLSKNEIKQRTKQCFAMVGLENVEHLNPSRLSGGMKKRVGLARAIAYQPEYILYDEPTTGLDPIMSDIINNLILNLKKYLHVTSIVVTHDMNSAYKIADRIMMLCGGNIIFNGTSDEVRNTKNKYVKQFIEGSSMGSMHSDRIFEMGKRRI